MLERAKEHFEAGLALEDMYFSLVYGRYYYALLLLLKFRLLQAGVKCSSHKELHKKYVELFNNIRLEDLQLYQRLRETYDYCNGVGKSDDEDHIRQMKRWYKEILKEIQNSEELSQLPKTINVFSK